jgi:hypothetical protein
MVQWTNEMRGLCKRRRERRKKKSNKKEYKGKEEHADIGTSAGTQEKFTPHDLRRRSVM